MASAPSSLYVRFDRRNQPATYSVLRSLPLSAEPTQYASGLVRMVGGMLIAGTAPDGPNAVHLFSLWRNRADGADFLCAAAGKAAPRAPL